MLSYPPLIERNVIRSRAAGKASAEGARKTRQRDRIARAMPAPEANAELQGNIDVSQILFHYRIVSYFFKFVFLFEATDSNMLDKEGFLEENATMFSLLFPIWHFIFLNFLNFFK